MDLVYTFIHLCLILLAGFILKVEYRISRAKYEHYAHEWLCSSVWKWMYFQNTWVEEGFKYEYTRVFGYCFQRVTKKEG